MQTNEEEQVGQMKKEEEYEYRLWIDEIGKENQVNI